MDESSDCVVEGSGGAPDDVGSQDAGRRGRVDPATKARFEEIALPHLDTVYRIARTMVPDSAEVDDLVQETFIRAFKAFDRFELRAYGPRPWLLRILHNVLYTAKGRQRREPTLLDDLDFAHFADELDEAQTLPDSANAINWDCVDGELKAAIDELQPVYRTVLLLWAIAGLSYREIAEVCGCPIGTVMSRLYRVRQQLGRELREFAVRRNLKTERFD